MALCQISFLCIKLFQSENKPLLYFITSINVAHGLAILSAGVHNVLQEQLSPTWALAMVPGLCGWNLKKANTNVPSFLFFAKCYI